MIRNILDGYEFVPHTPNTITDERIFRDELKKVRSLGYAIDNQENEPGVQCVAVPVRDHLGQVVAAISMSSSIAGIQEERMESMILLLKQTADKISRKLGYGIHSQNPVYIQRAEAIPMGIIRFLSDLHSPRSGHR